MSMTAEKKYLHFLQSPTKFIPSVDLHPPPLPDPPHSPRCLYISSTPNVSHLNLPTTSLPTLAGKLVWLEHALKDHLREPCFKRAPSAIHTRHVTREYTLANRTEPSGRALDERSSCI